jgi:hypothetical protein
MAWAWEQDLINSLPRFPRPREQRNVAGRHYLTKAELNALYFATYQMRRPKGWHACHAVGRYWRAALVLFFNYGVDTGTIWKCTPYHEPILWRHVCWERQSPDRDAKEQSPWGWLFYRRVKTGKAFHRPMNRDDHAHLKSIMPEQPQADEPVFLGGGARPNSRFEALCQLASIQLKKDIETGDEKHRELKDLRKTCATYYDEHMPESSIDPGTLRRRHHVPTLCPPRANGLQSHHDAPPTLGISHPGQRVRLRVSLLPPAIPRRSSPVNATEAVYLITSGVDYPSIPLSVSRTRLN